MYLLLTLVHGLDAHKKLERLEMKYSLEIELNITNLVIQNLLNSISAPCTSRRMY